MSRVCFPAEVAAGNLLEGRSWNITVRLDQSRTREWFVTDSLVRDRSLSKAQTGCGISKCDIAVHVPPAKSTIDVGIAVIVRHATTHGELEIVILKHLVKQICRHFVSFAHSPVRSYLEWTVSKLSQDGENPGAHQCHFFSPNSAHWFRHNTWSGNFAYLLLRRPE